MMNLQRKRNVSSLLLFKGVILHLPLPEESLHGIAVWESPRIGDELVEVLHFALAGANKAQGFELGMVDRVVQGLKRRGGERKRRNEEKEKEMVVAVKRGRGGGRGSGEKEESEHRRR